MGMVSRIVSCVLLACCMLGNVSLGFQTPLVPRSLARLQDSGRIARYDTSLQMGLRSFLKKKVLGRKEDSDAKDTTENLPKKESKGTVASEEKAAATTINITDTPVAKTEAKTVEKESRKESKLPPLRTESIQDRLNRVRSGKMTDDEKYAFLRTALSAKDTATSRKPLRQQLPDEEVEGNRTASGNNATPFPTLLKNVASGWGKNDTRASEVPLRTWKDGVQMNDQRKKREYFEMVTDPNRFHTYKSSKVTAPGNTTEADVVHDGVIRPQLDMEEEETMVLEDDDDEGEEYEHMAQVAGDLGTRLEKAAIALEEAAKAREQERLEKEKRLEKQRLEQKHRLEELQKRQQLELEKKQLELKAKKREEEEAMAREIEKRRREEEARRREMMEAQDAYWAKKLQAERESRMQGMSQKQKEEFVKQEALEAKKAMEVAQQESTEPPAAPIATNYTNEYAPKFKKSDVGVKPKTILGVHKKTLDPFEEEQARKREEMERAKDEQIARLKALSSPLPSPSLRSPPTLPPPRTSDTAMRGASELSKLMNPPKSAPVPSIPVEEPKAEPTIAEMMNEADDEPELELTKEEPGFFKSVLGVKKNKDTAVAEKNPVRQAQSPEKDSGKRRVVRQKLPLGDEDDFDTFARNGPNKYMSISDAMKEAGASGPDGNQEERSKMWGVDMSRITKSLEDEKKN